MMELDTRRGSSRHALAALVLLAMGTLVLAGCSLRPLLSDVTVSPVVISPNADGTDDATNIAYRLARNALVSIYLEGADGQRHYFRRDRARSPGPFRVQWGGVVNEPRWVTLDDGQGRQLVKSWVLPDGRYTWTVEATDELGQTQQVTGTIDLAGGDTVVPELGRFTITLPTFTPNQDGLADRTGVSYYLNKDVEDVQVFLYDPARPDVQYPLEDKAGMSKVGEAGPHAYDYDGGVDRGADPPPDGTYVVQAEARDLAGHHVVVSRTLSIEDGGVPRAAVVNGTIEWGDAVRSLEGTEIYLPLGATLRFTTTVDNYGHVPIRTAGPPSGTVYRSDENYNTLAVELNQPSYHQQAGVWRFGINFDTSTTDFPYRWAVGGVDGLRREVINGQEQWFLDPGKRATVTGGIELVGPFPREEIYAWGGLIHEYVGIGAENNYIDRVLLHIGQP